LRYFNEPKTPAALAALKQAADTTARLQPGSVNAQLAQAYYLYRGLRDYRGALEAFSRVAEREPNNVDALLSLAYVERRLGDLDGALLQLTKAEALDPANPVLLSTKGEFLSAVRRYPEALAAFGKLQKLIPGNAFVIYRTADAYQAQGNLAAAEVVLEHGPRGDPVIESSLVEQAWLRNQPDRLAEACRQLGAYVDAHHGGWEFSKFDCDLRVAYQQHLQGKQADAMSACRSVLDALAKADFSDPVSGALITRGTANACLGNKVAALSDFAHAEALSNRDAKSSPLLELYLARAQVWLGDNDAAIALLTHSLTVPYGTAVGFLRLDPFWQPLRNDPRFKALLAGR
jgi:serine/threonine-protein kinase